MEGIPYFYGAVIGNLHKWRPVDKQLPLTKIKSSAVEAFGRHLKRVDASALFLFGCKIWPVKTYISIGKRRNCGCFSARM